MVTFFGFLKSHHQASNMLKKDCHKQHIKMFRFYVFCDLKVRLLLLYVLCSNSK